MTLKSIIWHIINACAKAFVLSFLIAKTLESYGVHDIFWQVVLTMPISFALYNWYGLVVMESAPTDPTEGKES